MGTISSILLVIIVVASIVFIVYDSRKKRRAEPKWIDHDCAGYLHTKDGHHPAHPGCLGHPKGCEHMMTEHERKDFEEEISG